MEVAPDFDTSLAGIPIVMIRGATQTILSPGVVGTGLSEA